MAKTSAERQAAYRQRRIIEGQDERLNIIIPQEVSMAIRRLAKHHGMTQAGLIDRIVTRAQRVLLDEFTEEQRRAYYDAVTV